MSETDIPDPSQWGLTKIIIAGLREKITELTQLNLNHGSEIHRLELALESLQKASNNAVTAWNKWVLLDDLDPTTEWLDAMDDLENELKGIE